jgi:hypothetical protein
VSRIGHADALLAADQKLLAEMLLKRCKLLAQGRLGDMQYIRSARDTAGINDDDKGFKPSNVHLNEIDPIIFRTIVQPCVIFAN